MTHSAFPITLSDNKINDGPAYLRYLLQSEKIINFVIFSVFCSGTMNDWDVTPLSYCMPISVDIIFQKGLFASI